MKVRQGEALELLSVGGGVRRHNKIRTPKVNGQEVHFGIAPDPQRLSSIIMRHGIPALMIKAEEIQINSKRSGFLKSTAEAVQSSRKSNIS